MRNRVDNYEISIEEVSERLNGEIVQQTFSLYLQQTP